MSDSHNAIPTADSRVRAVTLKRRRGWPRLLLYFAIFASGVIVGGGITLTVARHRALHAMRHPEAMPARIASRMERTLSLSEAQRRDVERILGRRHETLQHIRREVRPQIEAQLDLLEEDISAVLNERQREKWQRRFRRLRRMWLPKSQSDR